MLPTYAPSPHPHSRLQPVPTFFSAEMLSPRARVSARGGTREVELFTNRCHCRRRRCPYGRRGCRNNQNHMEWVSKILPLPVTLPCPLPTEHESKLILMLGGAVFLAFMNTMACTFIYPKLTHPCYPFSSSLVSAVSHHVISLSLLG